MEGRRPPDDDDLFEWTDMPPRAPREPAVPDAGEPERGETGERERLRRRPPESTEQRPPRGDTGEFERSGHRPPPGRRERHRDLPARVRRRQAIGIGAVAVVVIVVLIVLISGGGEEGPAQPPVGVKRLIGQSIVAPAKGSPSQDLLKRVRQGQVGSVIVLPKNAQSLRTDVQRLQQAALSGKNPPLLVMIDQEGGPVKRLPDGPPDTSPQDLGKSDDEGQSKDEGQKTGSYLRGLGVNVDLAPVLDVSQPETAATIKSRTFGSDPGVVSTVGVAFGEGLQDGGTIATAKHFPGLGRATVSTDDRPVSIAATSEQLQSDLDPFQAAVDAGVGMVMVSTASYPTLGSKKQAAFSPAIVRGLLRDRLGYDGVVITDDLEAPAVTAVTTPGLAAANALKAGDDLLLFAKSAGASDKAFGSLLSQIKHDQLNRALLEDAYERIRSLKDTLQ